MAIDASDVPSDYILAILSQCSTFPETLIFFLKGKMLVRRRGGAPAPRALPLPWLRCHSAAMHAAARLRRDGLHAGLPPTLLTRRRATCGCASTWPPLTPIL